MKRDRLPLLLIPVTALIPILPLLIYGCSCGHDFDFHVLNWLEAAQQFTHGNFHPQWAFTPAWNAGEPRFVFYPPLSWTLGAVLGLLMPWTWTPLVYTWLILMAAGFALQRLARSFVPPTAALLAAVFYLTNPYTLFTAYERTAYAELLAAVWIPLLLHAILRPESEGGVTISRIAVPVALLWLSNAPAAVMGCYALALLAVVRLMLTKQHRLRLAVTTLGGTALGLGLAAFYLIPAAWERRYVQIDMAVLPGLRIQDNTLFHHTTAGITDPAALAEAVFHDDVLHTASLIALLLLLLTGLSLLFVRSAVATRAPHPSQPLREPGSPTNALVPWGGEGWEAAQSTGLVLALAVLTGAVALLLTPLSAPIWHYAPELAFLQFPWRLLALLAAIAAFTLALAIRSVTLKPAATVAAALFLAGALTYPAYSFFRQTCDPEDTVAARATLFHSSKGSEPTDEYTPTAADNDAVSHSNPPYWLAQDADAFAPAETRPGAAPMDLTLDLAMEQALVLNLRTYPAWRITRNSSVVGTLLPRTDGLIAFALPAGRSQIAIRYIQLPDQSIGLIVTALSLISLSGFLLRSNSMRP